MLRSLSVCMGDMIVTQLTRYRIIAIIAIAPGLLSIKEGGSVMLGISTPAYHVIRWLVMYNVVMGLVSLIAGTGIWIGRTWGSVLTALILMSHGLVFLAVFFLFIFREPVAPVSVVAMLLRTAIWLIIYWLLRWVANVETHDA